MVVGGSRPQATSRPLNGVQCTWRSGSSTNPAVHPALEADRMRLLVAEDDSMLREILVLGLEEAGYQVDAVERGDDAIDMLKFYEYDVALLDWRMPGAEGIDVVAWARRHTGDRRPSSC